MGESGILTEYTLSLFWKSLSLSEECVMSKTYGKKKNSSGWDFRRKVVALIALILVAFFVFTLAAQIFVYGLAM